VTDAIVKSYFAIKIDSQLSCFCFIKIASALLIENKTVSCGAKDVYEVH
jgi:hypothetical protein